MEINLGEIRVRQADTRNWVIETLEEVIYKDKEPRKEWKVNGYYGNIISALNKLPLKFLDKTAIASLKDIEKALIKFREDVLNAIEEVK